VEAAERLQQELRETGRGSMSLLTSTTRRVQVSAGEATQVDGVRLVVHQARPERTRRPSPGADHEPGGPWSS